MAMKIPKLDATKGLVGEFRENIVAIGKKLKDPTLVEEVGMPVAYPTGFAPFDYYNGMRVPVLQDDDTVEYVYDAIGLSAGSINLFVGRSSTGKTTHLIQCIGAIMMSNPEIYSKSFALYCDIEGGASKPRISQLTGMDIRDVNQKFVLKDRGIDHQTIFTIVKKHCDDKLARMISDPESVMYDTGIIEPDGKPKKEMVPTFVVIDSLDMLKTSKIQENDEIGGNTNGMINSKMNTELFSLLKPNIKRANVIFCCVCHIKDNINMNAYIPVSKQINYMKQSDKISGGKNIIYLANNIFQYESKTNEKDKDTNYGKLVGWESNVTLLKSRLNRAGTEFLMFFDQRTGFNREYSAFLFLYKIGVITYKGSRYYMPSGKGFYKKNLLKEIDNDPELAREFRDCIINHGPKVLSNYECTNGVTYEDAIVQNNDNNNEEELDMTGFNMNF